MKYIKYLIAYLCLLIGNSLIIYKLLIDLGYLDIKLTFGNREFLTYIIILPCAYLYHKYKPFKLTGNLDLYLKEKWNNYLDSQKTCPSCGRVVKASDIKNGKCFYCKDIDTIDFEKYPDELEEKS